MQREREKQNKMKTLVIFFPLNLSEFVISFFLEIVSTDMFLVSILDIELGVCSSLLHLTHRREWEREWMSRSVVVVSYKFAITFRVWKYRQEHWISISNFKSIHLTFLMFKWIRLKTKERFLSSSSFRSSSSREEDWIKMYFHLYYVSYANGKYVSHGRRERASLSAPFICQSHLVALPSWKSLKERF